MAKEIIVGQAYENKWGDIRVPIAVSEYDEMVHYIEMRVLGIEEPEFSFDPMKSLVSKATFYEKWKPNKSKPIKRETLDFILGYTTDAVKEYVALRTKVEKSINFLLHDQFMTKSEK